ncbi:MAG: hypothetical protein HY314_00790 [Acidobacteria bacterium]|nr:hypothetical protein [Acidobacteriota bacterium]
MLADLWLAKYEIEQFMCQAQQWRCVRDGVPLHPLGGSNLAVTLEFGKLIFSFWGDEFAESWRIENYQVQHDRLQLELSRQMGRQRIDLEVRPQDDAEPLPTEIHERRQHFQEVMCQIITQKFPDAVIERIATQRDDARQLSGIYTRAIFSHGRERMVSIGMNSQESRPDIDGLLTAAIIWFDRASACCDPKPSRLLLFAPAGQATDLARRLTAINPEPDVKVELYEVDERAVEASFVQPFDQGSLFDPSRHRLPRTRKSLAPNPIRDRLLKLCPELMVYHRPGSSMESLRLRGLEVARIRGGKLRFGLGAKKQLLNGDHVTTLTDLVQEVAQIRCADSEQKWHPYHRQQAERWLEEIIRQDVRALDVSLDPRYVYPQIPAHRDDEYGMVDLLAITEGGRLVIIELKVAEDAELPMQGLDYWLKGEWHRQRGDFHRRGYFRDMEIADEPALLFLVSPLLRFHRTFDLVASWIDQRVPAYKVGINHHWRQGIKVLFKERIHG